MALSMRLSATRLPKWPPRLAALVHDGRFWLIQMAVALVIVLFDIIEARGIFPDSWLFHDLPHEFVRDFVFIIPVTYAALHFGLVGALATALWCTVLTLPNWIFLPHSTDERIGPFVQLSVVYVVAFFVGSEVDREAAAHRIASAATKSLANSEARYRGVFETVRDGLLVLDGRYMITAANEAAARLLGRPLDRVIGHCAEAVLPQALRERMLSDVQGSEPVAVGSSETGRRWVVPVAQDLGDGEQLKIVMLRDVTDQRRRQAVLEQFAAAVLHAQEEERQRIAEELHDDTVQSLVLLCRRLDALDQELPAGEVAGVHQRIRELRTTTEQSLSSLRDYLHGLRPSALDDLGLIAAIRRLPADLGTSNGMDVLVTTDREAGRLSPDGELALYRIAQEALRNAERHSGARTVSIALRFSSTDTELTVQDDGQGFDLSASAEIYARGLGIRGMEERARAAGGTFSLRSTLGLGTTVIARIPETPQDGVHTRS